MIAPVVSADEVAALQQGRHVVLADVRWYLDGRDGYAAFEAAHLPGAIWIDLHHHLAGQDMPATEGRHPLPTAEDFATEMSRYGIGDDTVVVAYDDAGGITAGRLVVMLRMLGHDAALLDGGLTAWAAEGRPVATGPAPVPTPRSFTPAPWPADRLASAAETVAHAAAGGAVIDARPRERFTGEVTAIDPRPGHVPGARSAPWTSVLGPDQHLLPTEQLLAYYRGLGADGDTIAYCGSGVSACMNIIAMEHAGLTPPRLYVASFSGWSADDANPVELGEGNGR